MREPTVESLWKAHLAAKFPVSCYGRGPGGIDLVQLDSDVAGCVQTFLKRGRRLDAWRIAVLGICYHRCRSVAPRLRGRTKIYCERLEKMAGAVLREVERSTRRG